MKKLYLATALLIVATLFTACGNVQPTPTLEPTLTPTQVVVTPTVEPTPEPTVVPSPTPFPSKWRIAEIIQQHSVFQPSGEFNDKDAPIMENAFVGKVHVGERYWCKWPIQGDGERFCEMPFGEFAGYYLKVNRLIWVGP